MPKKNSRAESARQAEIRKQRDALYKQRQREYKAYQKSVLKEQKALLKKARELGIYNPKSEEITKYRKKRLRQVKQEYGQYLDDNKFFFVPAGEKARKKILERARNLQMPTTRTGLFVPKEGHKTARLKVNKKRDEFYIERRGKTKSGINKGRAYRDVTPLASIDELDRERNRLRRMADRFGPIDFDNGERLTFKVVENGIEGYSHATFDSIEKLLKYLERYPKSVAARVNFFRHVKIEKSSVNEWFARHKPRSPGKRDRRAVIRRK